METPVFGCTTDFCKPDPLVGVGRMATATIPSGTIPGQDGVAPLWLSKGGFLGWRDAISRRGGRKADVGDPVWGTGKGPLWPPVEWKGLLSTRHSGQPQGPQPRSTPPLPLRVPLTMAKNLPL